MTRAWRAWGRLATGIGVCLYLLLLFGLVVDVGPGAALLELGHVVAVIAVWELSRWVFTEWTARRRYGPSDGRPASERLKVPYRFRCTEPGCTFSFATSDPGVTASWSTAHMSREHGR